MPSIDRILIANRGEIALRIIRTCREMGISTVALYSDPDIHSPHVLAADYSVHIGEAPSSESYLSIEKILDAAEETGADAIHPGYGFLSENSEFARKCEEKGIIFIGPGPDAIQLMGDKTAARERVGEAGVPYPPGTKQALQSIEEARDVAEEIGFPVLVKAAAGGGGKGMRVIEKPDEFESALKGARSEAKNAFGDDRVYIEKYLKNPKHVEIQIVADSHGNVIHLFERECSIQRRHQKVIEEAPCSTLGTDLRNKMCDAAVAVAKSCSYLGAGTVEFLLDRENRFYFLEMNTRLQVEHPVTELITGIDLVELQIRIARGEELPVRQDEVAIQGHAIECRIYAEDPSDQFLPSTGRLDRHRPADGPGVRVDAGVEEGQNITIHYDPLISKLCTHGPSREAAIRKMKRALDEYDISGCRTTIPFCSYVMQHPEFRDGTYDTGFVPDHFSPDELYRSGSQQREIVSITAALLSLESSEKSAGSGSAGQGPVSDELTNWWKNRRE